DAAQVLEGGEDDLLFRRTLGGLVQLEPLEAAAAFGDVAGRGPPIGCGRQQRGDGAPQDPPLLGKRGLDLIAGKGARNEHRTSVVFGNALTELREPENPEPRGAHASSDLEPRLPSSGRASRRRCTKASMRFFFSSSTSVNSMPIPGT